MIYAKKSLGQNFLKDKNIINKIINLDSFGEKNIIEIGPGKGNLLMRFKKNPIFKTIEKDFSTRN